MESDRPISQLGSFFVKHRLLLAALSPIIAYLLALNPYFLPETYDNAIFFQGAKAIAESGHFLWQGTYVVDWGPGLSGLLAIPIKLGFDSVLAAKFTIVVLILCGAILAHRLFIKEARPFPHLTLAITLLLPLSLLQGTRIMADWPYTTFAFLFLFLLQKLQDKPSAPLVILAGVTLGYASLIRFIGVLLGAAVVYQGWRKIRSTKTQWSFKSALPEVIVAIIGASIFWAWKFWIRYQQDLGKANEVQYYEDGWIERIFSSLNPAYILEHNSQLLFQWPTIGGAMGLPTIVILTATLIPAGMILMGIVHLFRTGESRPMDAYAFLVIVLVSFLSDRAQTRYLLPIAPLLINYFLVGFHQCLHWVPLSFIRKHLKGSFHAAVALWMAMLTLLLSYLLIRGTSDKSHRGLCALASPSPASFYGGSWGHLYEACEWIANQTEHAGDVGTTAGMNRYVHVFTKRFVPDQLSDSTKLAFIVEYEIDPLRPDQRESVEIMKSRKFGDITVHKLKNSF